MNDFLIKLSITTNFVLFVVVQILIFPAAYDMTNQVAFITDTAIVGGQRVGVMLGERHTARKDYNNAYQNAYSSYSIGLYYSKRMEYQKALYWLRISEAQGNYAAGAELQRVILLIGDELAGEEYDYIKFRTACDHLVRQPIVPRANVTQ